MAGATVQLVLDMGVWLLNLNFVNERSGPFIPIHISCCFFCPLVSPLVHLVSSISAVSKAEYSKKCLLPAVFSVPYRLLYWAAGPAFASGG